MLQWKAKVTNDHGWPDDEEIAMLLLLWLNAGDMAMLQLENVCVRHTHMPAVAYNRVHVFKTNPGCRRASTRAGVWTKLSRSGSFHTVQSLACRHGRLSL